MDKVTGPVFLWRYGIAVCTVAIAIPGQLILDPILGADTFFVLLFALVMVSTWYGGLGPGLLAAALWGLTAEFLLADPPLVFSFNRGGLRQGVRLTLFLSEATLICWLTAIAREHLRVRESLKAASRRTDGFLAMLSHELRNPLAPIRYAVHLMQMAQLEDAALANARDVIERQVRQLAVMFDDLFDIFRLNHQQIPLQRESLDLAALVRQTIEDHRRPLEESGLMLAVNAPGSPVPILGDRTRLSGVLASLLHNAAKFSSRGAQVTVALRANLALQRATISVRDTGVGIRAELLPHVFDPFTQAEQGLDRRRGGLGLGLALVKGIVELHGGAVHVTSPGPGHGAEFSFWLPLDEHPEPVVERVPRVISSARQLRILIVEDNRDAAQTLGSLLRRFGHEVTTAHSGMSGLQAARQWRPDIVLCDLGLPEMDGYEVASLLRRDPAMATARLIAVSGYGQDEDRRRAEAAGFHLHLTKPLDLAELQRLLTEMNSTPQRLLPIPHSQSRMPRPKDRQNVE